MKHRSSRLWRKWDEEVRGGRSPAELLPALSDESLLELLMSGGEDRVYEKDVLLSETLNRLRRTRREVREATTEATEALEGSEEALREAARKIQRAEEEQEQAAARHGQAVRDASRLLGAARAGTDSTKERLGHLRDEAHKRRRGPEGGE